MDHVPIRVNTLRGEHHIDFDVYLKINDKWLLYLHRGDSFGDERLKKLKSKKLKKMYIRPEDESAYRRYVQRNLEGAYDDRSEQDIRERAAIIHGEQQVNTEEVFESPGRADLYELAKNGSDKYVQFLLNNADAVQAILKTDPADQSISAHGVNVSTLAVAVAQRQGIVDPEIVRLVALGALLHDIGHQDSTLAINRSLSLMSSVEQQQYRMHPVIGGDRVQDKRHYDPLVLKIIVQHEESADGSGFPNRLTDRELDPMVLLVSGANVLDRMVTFEGVSRTDAAKQLMLQHMGRYPLPQLQSLAEIIKN